MRKFSRFSAAVIAAGITGFCLPSVAQTKLTSDLSTFLLPVAFTSVGNGIAGGTVIRNRIFITRNLGQTSRWGRFLSSADQSALAGVDFQRVALVSLLHRSFYYETRITGAAIEGNTLFLTVQTEPQPLLTCRAAIALPGSPCSSCIAPSWLPDLNRGVYDVVAIDRTELRSVRRVVVTKEVETAPPLVGIC